SCVGSRRSSGRSSASTSRPGGRGCRTATTRTRTSCRTTTSSSPSGRARTSSGCRAWSSRLDAGPLLYEGLRVHVRHVGAGVGLGRATACAGPCGGRDRRMRDDAETIRLAEDAARSRNWKRWGPYLAERQWGTVREDYSASGASWDYFPHDHARSRVYRWGEDGLLGITDREGLLYYPLAIWNGKDPILKERLFGLTGPEGNHGEDVKECYFYLDATPTHSYLKALYKYPQREYPYAWLVEENRRRGKADSE